MEVSELKKTTTTLYIIIYMILMCTFCDFFNTNISTFTI